jgi:3-methylfumaryl-CoA hydratase
MGEQTFRDWIGRTEEKQDIAAAGPIGRLAALLDHENPPWAPGVLPPLGHWLFFLPDVRQSGIGSDGHAARGGFLPPIPLPRRMWAGGRIEFLRPIPLGVAMARHSTIADISDKTGSGGPMTFVVVRHEIFVSGEVALREEHDIVYRSAPAPNDASRPRVAPTLSEDADFRRSTTPGPVELFRYSALTFNGHRIHYDRDYAVTEEGYPGLVVHGPLIATLMIDNVMRWRAAAPIARFAYRARSPIFDGTRFDLCLKATEKGARIWAQPLGGPISMDGEVELRS